MNYFLPQAAILSGDILKIPKFTIWIKLHTQNLSIFQSTAPSNYIPTKNPHMGSYTGIRDVSHMGTCMDSDIKPYEQIGIRNVTKTCMDFHMCPHAVSYIGSHISIFGKSIISRGGS